MITVVVVVAAAVVAHYHVAAHDRFVEPFRKMCDKCRIVFARCERSLEGLESQLYNRSVVPYPEVDAPGVRVATLGPLQPAQKTCDDIAADMVKRGMRSAVCVGANRAPPIR
ncbi:MAG TPA: hypothetical protein VFI86_09185 [Burkholderiales bacterium]|nr:hypothetical protein [Burkholderiales bacterium]